MRRSIAMAPLGTADAARLIGARSALPQMIRPQLRWFAKHSCR